MRRIFQARIARVAALSSIVWILCALAVAIEKAESCNFDFSEMHCIFRISNFALLFLLAGVLPVVLLWGIAWIFAGVSRKSKTDSEDRMQDSAAASGPACPDCGARTTLRTARSGKYAGTYFWGCTNYPDCVCIVSIAFKS